MLGSQDVDTIEEVQILTANYSAEYGRSSAGQIRFVTKSENAKNKRKISDLQSEITRLRLALLRAEERIHDLEQERPPTCP